MKIQLTNELRVVSLDSHNWALEYWAIPKGKGGKPPKGQPSWKALSYHSLVITAITSALDYLAKQEEGNSFTLNEFKDWYEAQLKEIKDNYGRD